MNDPVSIRMLYENIITSMAYAVYDHDPSDDAAFKLKNILM